MTIKNGDKAASHFQSCGTDGLPSYEAEFGLTKREMMAMHMMAGMLSKSGHSLNESDVARDATRAADALLAELERAK